MLTVSDNHIVLGGGGGGGSGDVVGAASSTDNALARFDGTTGKLVQNSNVIVADTGNFGIGRAPEVALDIAISTSAVVRIQSVNANNGGAAIYASRADGNGTLYAMGDASGILGGTPDQKALIWTSTCDLEFRIGNTNSMYVKGATGFIGINTNAPTDHLDVNGAARFRYGAKFNGQIIDNVGSSGADGQVLKKVGGLVVWSNP